MIKRGRPPGARTASSAPSQPRRRAAFRRGGGETGALRSISSGTNHLKTRRVRRPGLGLVMGHQARDVKLNPNFRSARVSASSAATPGKILAPRIFLIRAVWTAGFQGRHLAGEAETRTSLATGWASRAMRISFSTCKAASASGQRWRKSGMVIVFMDHA